MLATAKQEKYGIPVSGRVDVSIVKKLKEEANTLELSMSRMVHVALSEWANTEECRGYANQLEIENKALKNKLDVATTKIKEWDNFHSQKVTDINLIWQKAIGAFIQSLSDNGKKRQELTNTFNQIFQNV